MSRVRENRMPGSTGELEHDQAMAADTAPAGNCGDLSPASPTVKYLATSLPNLSRDGQGTNTLNDTHSWSSISVQ